MWLWDMLGTRFEGNVDGLWFLFKRYLSHLLCEMQDVVGGRSVVPLQGKERFARSANAHLSDDETVAKMGHPNVLWVRPGPPANRQVREWVVSDRSLGRLAASG
jgi:hypothetical protein